MLICDTLVSHNSGLFGFFLLFSYTAEECPEVKSNGELISLYATAEPRKKRTKLDSSGSSPVKGEIHVLHSDESIFSRIPHLHSKQNGASQEELTLENTLSPKKVIESGIVQAEVNRKLVGKENKKNASPTKNKFAVSSLIKRNKFHLDGVASMEINAKEVRSRQVQVSPICAFVGLFFFNFYILFILSKL